jgi:hypothetical protein
MSTTPITITGKMLARSGLAVELPGQPLVNTSAIPPGLDPGELGFAKDTGELFIGSDPNYQLFDLNRQSQFPYSNIRVLTETASSVSFIKDVVYQTQTQFSNIMLPANSSGPTGTTDLVWNTAQINVAEVRYMLCFQNVPTAIRKGTLSIAMNQSEATVVDNRVDVGMAYFNYTDPIAYENFSVFEVAMQVNAGVATLTYTNNTNVNARLFYSVVTFNAQY